VNQSAGLQPTTALKLQSGPPLGDRAFRWLTLAMALTVLVLVGLIGWELALGSRVALHKFGWHFLVSRDWDPAWGGGLGLWSHDPETGQPRQIEKVVDCTFNRAVLFDTTQNSWHGLPDPIRCPADRFRASLAVYYMIPTAEGVSPRERALFAPHKEQANDPEVLELIRKRSSSATAADVYRAQ